MTSLVPFSFSIVESGATGCGPDPKAGARASFDAEQVEHVAEAPGQFLTVKGFGRFAQPGGRQPDHKETRLSGRVSGSYVRASKPGPPPQLAVRGEMWQRWLELAREGAMLALTLLLAVLQTNPGIDGAADRAMEAGPGWETDGASGAYATAGGNTEPDNSNAQAKLDAMAAVAQAWRMCSGREAKAMAIRSKEPAETIATAALAMCSEQERALRRATWSAAGALGQSGVDADEIVDRNKASWRESLLAIIIKSR